jgi:hypothetical protein
MCCYGRSNTDASLASDLAAALRTTLGHLKRKLRHLAGPHDLTPSQVAVIFRLEKDGPATLDSESFRPQMVARRWCRFRLSCSPCRSPNDGKARGCIR